MATLASLNSETVYNLSPPARWRDIELRETFGKSDDELHGRRILAFGRFWLVRPKRQGFGPPEWFRIVHTDLRKERKY